MTVRSKPTVTGNDSDLDSRIPSQIWLLVRTNLWLSHRPNRSRKSIAAATSSHKPTTSTGQCCICERTVFCNEACSVTANLGGFRLSAGVLWNTWVFWLAGGFCAIGVGGEPVAGVPISILTAGLGTEIDSRGTTRAAIGNNRTPSSPPVQPPKRHETSLIRRPQHSNPTTAASAVARKAHSTNPQRICSDMGLHSFFFHGYSFFLHSDFQRHPLHLVASHH